MTLREALRAVASASGQRPATAAQGMLNRAATLAAGRAEVFYGRRSAVVVRVGRFGPEFVPARLEADGTMTAGPVGNARTLLLAASAPAGPVFFG